MLLDKGRIAAVGEGLEAPAGATVVDAGGCLVMPGGVIGGILAEIAG